MATPAQYTQDSTASGIDRAHIEAFISQYANRVPLVLFGSKDAMVHALYTITANEGDSRNGEEAWAYVPPTIASRTATKSTPMASPPDTSI